MTAIVLSVTNLLLVARRSDETPAWVPPRLEALERQSRHFVRRTTSLLDASRLAAGPVSIHPEPMDLGPRSRARSRWSCRRTPSARAAPSTCAWRQVCSASGTAPRSRASVLELRDSDFEPAIREFVLTPRGLDVIDGLPGRRGADDGGRAQKRPVKKLAGIPVILMSSLPEGTVAAPCDGLRHLPSRAVRVRGAARAHRGRALGSPAAPTE